MVSGVARRLVISLDNSHIWLTVCDRDVLLLHERQRAEIPPDGHGKAYCPTLLTERTQARTREDQYDWRRAPHPGLALVSLH